MFFHIMQNAINICTILLTKSNVKRVENWKSKFKIKYDEKYIGKIIILFTHARHDFDILIEIN